MGLAFYSLISKPKVFDVVWCLWPERGSGMQPGPTRPVLVIDVEIREDTTQPGVQFASITAQYGGTYEAHDLPNNLLIGANEFAELGLHKPTLFRMDLGNRRRLPFAPKYFLPQSYVKASNLIAGSLTETQITRAKECFAARGLTFPIPLPD
jgi:hypothetical protein